MAQIEYKIQWSQSSNQEIKEEIDALEDDSLLIEEYFVEELNLNSWGICHLWGGLGHHPWWKVAKWKTRRSWCQVRRTKWLWERNENLKSFFYDRLRPSINAEEREWINEIVK